MLNGPALDHWIFNFQLFALARKKKKDPMTTGLAKDSVLARARTPVEPPRKIFFSCVFYFFGLGYVHTVDDEQKTTKELFFSFQPLPTYL